MAQTVPFQTQPMTQPRVQQAPVQQGTIQQQPIQQQPIQAPPFGMQNSTSVYQQPSNISQPVAQPAAPQVPMGTNMMPPIRVAQAEQPIVLYNPTGTNQIPQNIQPIAAQTPPPGMNHMGRSESANKVIPFFLSPAEQQQLDDFLTRWEKYSANIKRYDVNFNMFIYDPTIPGAQPNEPYKKTFGYFKYIANPMRFLFAIEGEWQNDKQIKRDGDKNLYIHAEKTMINEKSVYRYDYNSKTVIQINVPPEMIGKGIADSPLPLIFGAKADELKRRFSMKIEPIPGRDDLIWLHARPLLIEDQQEFKALEILIEAKTLQARGLRQWEINGKTYKVFELKSIKYNDRLASIMEDINTIFKPTVERGWKHEITDWVAQPPPTVALPQPQIGNPPQAPPRNETPLYPRTIN